MRLFYTIHLSCVKKQILNILYRIQLRQMYLFFKAQNILRVDILNNGLSITYDEVENIEDTYNFKTPFEFLRYDDEELSLFEYFD